MGGSSVGGVIGKGGKGSVCELCRVFGKRYTSPSSENCGFSIDCTGVGMGLPTPASGVVIEDRAR